MNQINIRQAVNSDMRAIETLLSQADRSAMNMPLEEAGHAIGQGLVFLIEQGNRLAGACGIVVGPETVAQIRLVALLDVWPVSEALPLLLGPIRETARAKGVQVLACVGIESWLISGLLNNGFHLDNTVITLQKTDFSLPAPGNANVLVRPAMPDDFSAIIEIDQLAFDPLWQHTLTTLIRAHADAACFFVAVPKDPARFNNLTELGSQVVGYAYGNLIGRHAHLSRIAIHPHWQGKHIGVRLLAETIRFFQQRRAFGITLNTQQDNVRSRRLYEWFGFEVLGQEAQVLLCDI